MTVQNVQTKKPVKNTLAKLENVRGISSAISCVAYVEEGDKALLSFTLDRITPTSGEHQATFAIKNDFVSPNYNSMYSSGVLSSVTGNDVTFYNCVYDGTTKELTVNLFPELSTGSTKISNQRVLIILTSDAVSNTEDTATVATSAEINVDISREFTNSTPIALDISTVGASIVAFYGGYSPPSQPYNPPSVPSLPIHNTVTFNTNGGSANPASRSINPGAMLGSLPSPPTRAHHTFMGWFNVPDTIGGTEFRANTTISSNVTLWARWRTNPPTILTPHNNATVEHQNLDVTWNLVSNATYTIQMRNLRTNSITLSTVNLPAGRGQFTIPASALTAGARHRVAVSAVTPNAINGWDEREFNVRGATYNSMSSVELAQEILDRHYNRSASGRRIHLPRWADNMTDENGRSAYMNIVDTVAGLEATRSDVSNTGVVIGGTVPLSIHLLRAILLINDRFGTVTINSITGGRHVTNSNHYTGRAVDFQSDNWHVRGTNPLVQAGPIIDYLRGTHGFTTQNPRGYIGAHNVFHLDILNE